MGLTYSLAVRPFESLGLLSYRRPFSLSTALCRQLLTFISRRSFSSSSDLLSLDLPILHLPFSLLSSIFL
jgi:hypothetical protein